MKQAAFGDRVKQIGEWFHGWNSCEQTIALYSLLTKVSATQARFLFLVLENALNNGHDSQELARLEKQANSGGISNAQVLRAVWSSGMTVARVFDFSTLIILFVSGPQRF